MLVIPESCRRVDGKFQSLLGDPHRGRVQRAGVHHPLLLQLRLGTVSIRFTNMIDEVAPQMLMQEANLVREVVLNMRGNGMHKPEFVTLSSE